MKLTDLVASYKDILPEPAGHYGEIIRLSAPDFHPTVVSFDLAAAMADPSSAPVLQPLDTVRIFSRFDLSLHPPSLLSERCVCLETTEHRGKLRCATPFFWPED